MRYILAVFIILIGCSFGAASYNSTIYNKNQILVKQKVVEFDSRYYAGLEGYYEVGEDIRNYRHKEQLEDLYREIRNLKKELDAFKDKSETPTEQPKPDPVEPTEPTETPNTDVDVDDNVGPTELDIAVYHIFKANCAKCHNEVKQSADIQLVNSARKSIMDLDLEARLGVYQVVRGVNLEKYSKKQMPLGGQLEDKDVETIFEWALEKADIKK